MGSFRNLAKQLVTAFLTALGFVLDLAEDVPPSVRYWGVRIVLVVLFLWMLLIAVGAARGSRFAADTRASNRRLPLPRWVTLVWIAAFVIVLASMWRLLPPGWASRLPNLRIFLLVLSGAGLLGWFSLWGLWFYLKGRGKPYQQGYVASVQLALLVVVSVGGLSIADSQIRTWRPPEQDAVLVIADPETQAVVAELQHFCSHMHSFLPFDVSFTCEVGQLPPVGQLGQEKFFRQYRELRGYSSAIWLLPKQKYAVPASLAADLPNDLLLTATDDGSAFSLAILEFVSLRKCDRGQMDSVARLASAWRRAGLLAESLPLTDYPAYVECLVNAALDSNNTLELDRLWDVVDDTLRRQLASPPKASVEPQARERTVLTYARWLAYSGQYKYAERQLPSRARTTEHQANISSDDPSRQPFYRTTLGEVYFAGCQSPSNPDRPKYCQQALEFFAPSEYLLGDPVASYNAGRARVLLSMYQGDATRARLDRDLARRQLQEVTEKHDAPCVRSDAALWLAFAESLDNLAPQGERSPTEDSDCRFTVFYDFPEDFRTGTAPLSIGLPGALGSVTIAVSPASGDTAAWSAPLRAVKQGVYKGEIPLPASSLSALTQSRPDADQPLYPAVVGRYVLSLRDAHDRKLGRASVTVKQPYAVAVTLGANPSDGSVLTGRSLRTSRDSVITATAVLETGLPMLSKTHVLDDPEVLGRLALCLEQEGAPLEKCRLKEMAATGRSGSFERTWQPESTDVITYSVRVVDRLAGAEVARSAPFTVQGEPTALPPNEPAIVQIVVFAGELWPTWEAAAGIDKVAQPLGVYPSCTAAEEISAEEGVYHVRLVRRGVAVPGYVTGQQVQFLRGFAEGQIDDLWLGKNEVVVRDRSGVAAYTEPPCAIFEPLAELPKLWKVAIYRRGEELPFEGFIDDAVSPIELIRLPKH